MLSGDIRKELVVGVKVSINLRVRSDVAEILRRIMVRDVGTYSPSVRCAVVVTFLVPTPIHR
jgi:hypothetical protein